MKMTKGEKNFDFRAVEDRQLSGTQSQRGIQRRTAQTGSHQQTGQHHGALAADQSGAPRGAQGCRAAAGLATYAK
jgi:hypothetical protein